MKKYRITIEWKIWNTQDENRGYFVGISTLVTEASSYVQLMNIAIDFCHSIPSWEFERNHIDLNEYKDKKYCTYHYRTEITSISKIEKVN